MSTRAKSGSAAGRLTHLDVEERVARGRAVRTTVPRSSLGAWEPAASRPDPATLLAQQEVSRVPELVPLRHERMLASPFAFYRGAAVVMASDLGAGTHTGLRVQLCGDAHLANFGGFASPERDVVFDINDFDETNPGPFEWDVQRLVASFEIAARAREFTSKTARGIVVDVARAYREAMAQFASMGDLDVWYSRLDATQALTEFRRTGTAADMKRVERTLAKGQGRDNVKALAKLTRRVDGELRINSDPPLLVPLRELLPDAQADELSAWLAERFRAYRGTLQHNRKHLLEGFRMTDYARKVVGVGSVGTRCWIILLFGKDETDPLFLQIKQAEASVLEPYSGKSHFAHHGQRVVEGQRLLQATSDIFLGWLRAVGPDGVERDFYVRQMWDSKISADIDTMPPEIMKFYAKMCGQTLARGHARTGDRVAIAAYLGSADTFDRAMADFASVYADQNERDYERVKNAHNGHGPAATSEPASASSR